MCLIVPADGIGDGEELHVALNRDVFVINTGCGQLERHHGHVEGEHRHPAGGIGLLQFVSLRQRLRAVVNRDIVESEKPPGKHAIAVDIFAVDPPCVMQQQLVQHPAA